MLTALDNGELKPEGYDLSSWRLMHSGAQPIPQILIRHWKGYFLGVDYETHYGLTESAGPCVHLGTQNLHKIGAIGRPNLNIEKPKLPLLIRPLLLAALTPGELYSNIVKR